MRSAFRAWSVPVGLAGLLLQTAGCAFDFTERDILEMGAGLTDLTALPVAAVGPQPFADASGECYYAYRSEIRRLRDDSVVFDRGDFPPSAIVRAACLGECDLRALVVYQSDSEAVPVRGIARSIMAFDERTGTQRCVGQALPVVDMAYTPASGKIAVALATSDDPEGVESVLALCDPHTGEIEVRQAWSVRDLHGLDSTPDGATLVCAGKVNGVEGVYWSHGAAPSAPVLLEPSGLFPSIRADGLEVAMVRSDPERFFDAVRFRDVACVRIVDLQTGTRRDIEIGRNVAVFGLQYVENPQRLLASGARASADETIVEWLIWSIGPDGVVDVLRRWNYERGELVPDS